jgi:hypothetical protein
MIIFLPCILRTRPEFLFYCADDVLCAGHCTCSPYTSGLPSGHDTDHPLSGQRCTAVEMMNANFKAQHGAEEKETEPEEPKKN